MITRATYQQKRYALLASMIDVANSDGLELGACDLPSVQSFQGRCRYADFRSANEMRELLNLPAETVCEVDYVISRDLPLSLQIPDRFDYIIACHVLEHVPDVITWLKDMKALLKTGADRLIFLTIPDKIATPDITRPSTSVDHLMMDFFDQAKYPSFEHVLEHHRHWVGQSRGTGPISIEEGYPGAVENFNSGTADVHCHVWTGDEFYLQCQLLLASGFLPGLALAHYEPTTVLNEFVIALRTT